MIDGGVADPDRIAIFGWSYGGHAVLLGLTETPELYACGIDLWGVSNMFTFYEGFPPYWRPSLETIYEQFGHPEDDRDLLDEISPALHADRIVRPLLIAQGGNDPRVPRRESEQMVAALRERGLPVTYILKEDEGHGFRKPENRLELYREIEAFLAQHLG